MKKYFVQYKPFLVFLASFFGSYILLTLIYQLFLNGFGSTTVDSITELVAKNTEKVVSWFFMHVQTETVINEPFVRLYFQNKYIVRIVEGCNAISVIILYISFIIAFSGSFKNTLLFIFGGGVIIYILNVLRISLLVVLIYYYPEQKHIWHDLVFPAIIYGSVFILWIIWVKKFSKYAK